MKKIRSKYSNPDFQFVRFTLSGREFGIDLSDVREIIRHCDPEKRAPAPDFVEGFIRLRSMQVPVVDLRKRYNLPASLAGTCRIIITSVDGHIAGFVVDEVTDITLGAREVIVRPEGKGEAWDHCVEASVDTGSARVLILNPSEILSASEKSSLASPVRGAI